MNTLLLANLRSMDEQELYRSIYRDHLTGLHNRRAFETMYENSNFIALVDMDSLKYLNDNHGYRVGDGFLDSLAQQLRTDFGDDLVFRLAGDEFVVLGNNWLTLQNRLYATRLNWPGFSFGIAAILAEADQALKKDKKAREQLGARAGRGERPLWLEKVGTAMGFHPSNFASVI